MTKKLVEKNVEKRRVGRMYVTTKRRPQNITNTYTDCIWRKFLSQTFS